MQQQVDAGNTLLLKAKATMMNAENYAETIEALDQDGMLSDEVILALMQNTMAPGVAKTIALVNNSPLPQQGKDQIDEMTDVDESLRDILKQYQEGENAREIKEREIGQIKAQKRKNISELVKYVAGEDDSYLNLQLIGFLETQHTVPDNKMALRFALGENDRHKADEILSDLQTMAQGLEQGKKEALENYLHLQTIAISAEYNWLQSDSIVAANAEFLFAMAGDTLHTTCVQAQNLLQQAGLADYWPVINLPVPGSTKSLQTEDPLPPRQGVQHGLLKLYPNPADERLYVEYCVIGLEKGDNNEIRLYSEKGELLNTVKIQQEIGIAIINLRNLAPGVYMIRLGDAVEKFTKM